VTEPDGRLGRRGPAGVPLITIRGGPSKRKHSCPTNRFRFGTSRATPGKFKLGPEVLSTSAVAARRPQLVPPRVDTFQHSRFPVHGPTDGGVRRVQSFFSNFVFLGGPSLASLARGGVSAAVRHSRSPYSLGGNAANWYFECTACRPQSHSLSRPSHFCTVRCFPPDSRVPGRASCLVRDATPDATSKVGPVDRSTPSTPLRLELRTST